jgi:hypothetical protein
VSEKPMGNTEGRLMPVFLPEFNATQIEIW